MARQIDVETPFDFCQKCEKFALESRTVVGAGVVYYTDYSCKHADICGYVVPLSRNKMPKRLSEKGEVR